MGAGVMRVRVRVRSVVMEAHAEGRDMPNGQLGVWLLKNGCLTCLMGK
jgi:hypothetical protein